MRVVRSYSNVWKVEKMFYGVNDWHLPRPVPMMTVSWWGAFVFLSIVFKGFPPFVFTDNMLMNHGALPILFAWLMNKARFDGKTPTGFLRSMLVYAVSPRAVVRSKEAKVQDICYTDICITIGKRTGKGAEEEIAEISD